MSLRWRIVLFSAGSILLILALLSFFGISATKESTNQVLAERLVLAEQVAHNIDFNVQQTMNYLNDVAMDPNSNELLKGFRQFSPLKILYVSVLDQQGRAVNIEPQFSKGLILDLSQNQQISAALASDKTVVTDMYLDNYVDSHVTYLVTPLRNQAGNPTPMSLCAAIDISSSSIANLVTVGGVGKTGYIELVDTNGIVLSSSNSANLLKESDHGGVFAGLIQNQRTAVSTCHNCHVENSTASPSKEIITFAPLSMAPWGVVVRQPEQEALANTRHLQEQLAVFSLICLLVLLPLIWFATRSITTPINRLTLASKKIAEGSLDEPIAVPGKDEIGILARSFDTMRVKLKDSMHRIQLRTQELEGLNAENSRLYQEVRNKEKVLEELLKHSISAQEEERKRIARELHDETSQSLTTLSIGLATIAKSPPKDVEKLQVALNKNQQLTLKILDDVHRLILDLRPSVLDDLGLVPALEWYAKNRLEPERVKVHFETSGTEERLPSHIEVALFRIAQEAISNIALHAKSEAVSISLDFEPRSIRLTIEDDGTGFKSEELLSSATGIRGLGLRGMMERTDVLGGSFKIQSQPGSGTQVRVEIPVTWKG
jgi:signal transduction histidine kinase